MSLTNSGYFAMIYLCLPSGGRRSRRRRAPRLNRTWERLGELSGRRIYHWLMSSIISAGAATVNTRDSRFYAARKRRMKWELKWTGVRLPAVLCLTLVLEVPLKLAVGRREGWEKKRRKKKSSCDSVAGTNSESCNKKLCGHSFCECAWLKQI